MQVDCVACVPLCPLCQHKFMKNIEIINSYLWESDWQICGNLLSSDRPPNKGSLCNSHGLQLNLMSQARLTTYAHPTTTRIEKANKNIRSNSSLLQMCLKVMFWCPGWRSFKPIATLRAHWTSLDIVLKIRCCQCCFQWLSDRTVRLNWHVDDKSTHIQSNIACRQIL